MDLALLIERFAPQRPSAAALLVIPILVMGAGMMFGLWALLSGMTDGVKAGRGMAITGLCITGLLVMLFLSRVPSRQRARPQPAAQQRMP